MTAPSTRKTLWAPHPDDEADVRAAIADADAGRLLTPEQSEEFLAWLTGECEKPAWLDESE